MRKNMIFLAITHMFGLTFTLSAHAIINGKVVEADQYPARSAVMVIHNPVLNGGRGLCSGTLIAENLVLTAAHCVVNLDNGESFAPDYLNVHFGNHLEGAWDISKVVKVADYRFHAGYNYNGDVQDTREVHDIALLKIEKVAPTGFVPVKVLADQKVLDMKPKTTIAGFGLQYYIGDPRESKARILRKFDYDIIDARSPRSGMIEFYQPSGKTITIEEFAKMGGMAGGDSGGPAYVEVDGVPHVAGVASGYRVDDVPSYENVPSHIDWLRSAAREMGIEPQF